MLVRGLAVMLRKLTFVFPAASRSTPALPGGLGRRLWCALALALLALCAAPTGADWQPIVKPGHAAPLMGDSIAACTYSYEDIYQGNWPFQKSDYQYNLWGNLTYVSCTFRYNQYFAYSGGANLVCSNGQTGAPWSPSGCAPPPQDDPGPPRCPAGNPINLISGNKSETVTDFSTEGPNPLAFARHYDSQWTELSRLSAGWRSNFDRSFLTYGGGNLYVRLVLGDGRVALFSQSGSSWVPAYRDASGNVNAPRTDVSWSLTQNSSGFVFTDEDGTVENYNTALRLTSIVFRGGYTQTLGYDANGNNTTVTDSFGRQIGFTYSSAGALLSATAPDGGVYQYQYLDQDASIDGGPANTQALSAATVLSQVIYPVVPPANPVQVSYQYENTSFPSALTGITDERGVRFATWTYDSNGYATSSQHANGVEYTSIQYDLSGNTRTVTNAAGKQAVYHLAARQGPLMRIASIQGQASASCAASVKQYGYDSNGYVNQRIDAEGRTSTWTNDSKGHPLSRTDAAGTSLARTTTMSWLSAYRVPTQIVKPGLTINLSYDGAGRLTQRQETDTTTQAVPYSTNGQVRTWTYTYNTAGLLATVDGPLPGSADLTSYGYSTSGYLTSVTNALGQVTQVTSVNGLGQPLVVIDANGVETDLAYDARGRLTQYTVNPGANQARTQIGYDAAGDVSSITQPNGTSYTLSYDDAKRLSSIQNGAGETIQYTRNAMDGVTATAVHAGNGSIVRSAAATFDELNRLLSSIGAGGQTTGYSYDRTDNLTGVTDPLSHQYAYAYDALNRLISESGPLQYTVSYGYDAQDHRTSVTDPLGHTTSYIYDGFGDVISRTSPDTGTTVYTYDPRGLVLTRTDAAGTVTTFTYDLLGRTASTSYSTAPSETVTYGYDDVTSGNHGIGRRTSMTDASGSTRYFYNALGQVTQEQRSISGVAYLTQYSYDPSGLVLSISYPSGRVVSYQRDGQGRITGATTQDSYTPSPVSVASGGSYMPYGPLAGFTYGNGLAYNAGYDADYRLASLATGQGATTVQNLHYGYDANGNITSITDNLDSSRNQALGYDALNRLSSASGAYGSYAYGYDAAGNRSSRTIAGTPETYGYDSASSRLLSISGGATRSLSYAATGQVTGDSRGVGQVYGYTLDGAGMMAAATLNGTPLLGNVYDGEQHRVEKDVPGASGYAAQYLYDRDGHLLSEASPGGPVRDYIWLNDRPVAQIDYNPLGFTQLAYLHADQVNRPQKASNPNQTLAWDGVTGPFGEAGTATGSLTMNLGFLGQYFDQETGLYQNWHRDYDAGTGRYLESDPIGLKGGINTYAYVGGNPLNAIDPLGLSGLYCIDGGSGDDKLLKMCDAQHIPQQPTPEEKKDTEQCVKKASDKILETCEKSFFQPAKNSACQQCWKIYQEKCY